MTPEQRPILPLWAATAVMAASGPILDNAFPEVGFWPSIFPGIAAFLVPLIGRTVAQSAALGFLGGMTFYLTHISWASLFLGPIPMTALSVLQSLFVALGAVAINRAFEWMPRHNPSRATALVAMPLAIGGLWTAREAISAVWPYGGFAWGRAALSQTESPFAQLLPWLGISGTSFVLVVLTAAGIQLLRSAARLPEWGIAAAVLTGVLIVPAFPVPSTGSMLVAAVQGNGKAAYFDSREPGDLLRAQLSATEPLFGTDVDLVVWPEGATDRDPLSDPAGAEAFDLVSAKLNAPLVAGAITTRNGENFNSSLLWIAGEGATDIYDKRNPIPFGEYVPHRDFWEPLAPDLIGLIQREYSPGTTDAVFSIDGILAGINICFDISDDTVMTEAVRDGAQILLAQTNNADFGRTDESVQQLAIARARALELGRSVVNISTVGTSAIVLADGSTLSQLEPYTADIMLAEVPLATAVTPAVRAGTAIEVYVSALGLVLLLFARPGRRSRSRGFNG